MAEAPITAFFPLITATGMSPENQLSQVSTQTCISPTLPKILYTPLFSTIESLPDWNLFYFPHVILLDRL